MNTLAILRGTFGNFRPPLLTTSATCLPLQRTSSIVNAYMPFPNCVLLGVLSVTFTHYRRLLRLALTASYKRTITSNTRYRERLNAFAKLRSI